MIQTIYDDHKGNYGYRRMGLAARTRCKRKYSSYKGEIGKKADNLIQRQFEGAKPYEKCYTDVTEFALPNIKEKVYLSPILDGYNSEIIEFTLSRSPDLKQIQTMLKKAFPDDSYQGTILHSDQGWQYQHNYFRKALKEHGIIQSMSRKGNCYDNSVMETFFGRLKTEIYYGFEREYSSFNAFAAVLEEYINYYNNKRIQKKTKWMPPVKYREASMCLG